MVDTSLEGQIAIITGAASGIGKACAHTLAKEGVKVVVNYHNDKDDGQPVAQEIIDSGGTAIAIKADVSIESEVVAMFADVEQRFGLPDILVNNAGIEIDRKLVDMKLVEWQRVLDVNLTGYFLCAREAAKAFIKKGLNPELSKALGKIIFISSVHDRIPWAMHANYAASKGGAMLLMESIAQELAPQKIRVNSVSPGAIKTNINHHAWGTKEALNGLLNLIPYKRIGEPEDIGNAVAWLASDAADYITGATIYVDGGMTLYAGFAHGG